MKLFPFFIVLILLALLSGALSQTCPPGEYPVGGGGGGGGGGSTGCEPCPPGYYQEYPDSCTPCPAGEYQNVTGSGYCNECDYGTYSSGLFRVV